jgi:hypothetical protein
MGGVSIINDQLSMNCWGVMEQAASKPHPSVERDTTLMKI